MISNVPAAGGKSVDASQEMVALGLCNIFGSFVQSMPTTGSFSRTAVNSSRCSLNCSNTKYILVKPVNIF